jgi:hypothetical protein
MLPTELLQRLVPALEEGRRALEATERGPIAEGRSGTGDRPRGSCSSCPRCGGRLRLIATVEDPEAIRAILAAVAVSREVAGRAPPFAAPRDIRQTAAISA